MKFGFPVINIQDFPAIRHDLIEDDMDMEYWSYYINKIETEKSYGGLRIGESIYWSITANKKHIGFMEIVLTKQGSAYLLKVLNLITKDMIDTELASMFVSNMFNHFLTLSVSSPAQLTSKIYARDDLIFSLFKSFNFDTINSELAKIGISVRMEGRFVSIRQIKSGATS